jgi:hypothetical protein
LRANNKEKNVKSPRVMLLSLPYLHADFSQLCGEMVFEENLQIIYVLQVLCYAA